TGLIGGLFHAQHRMHHHHHDDADALGIIHPVDAGGGGCAVYSHRCPFSARLSAHLRPDRLLSPLFIQITCRFSGAFFPFTFIEKCSKTRRIGIGVNHQTRIVFMRIAMIGTGYVGLVSGACFSDFGHQVTCVDKDAGKIAALNRGEIPIYEPGLDALVASNVKAKRLDFTTELSTPVAEAEAVFIAVGTPSRRGDGHADLSYVYAAAREIAGALSGFTVVVTKSTVPVGTGDEVELIVRETNPSADVVVASNPEFLREGAAIRDFKFPDRIVIGTADERARKVLGDIYRPLSLNQ